MFSKNNNNNTYLFPHVSSSPPPSSYHHPRSSVVDLNGVEIFLHHHPEMFYNNIPLPENAALINQDDVVLTGDPMFNSLIQKKQTVKKDRHSKIFTAQGPRDRRVRLSIGIARKFFDLQETLGFDKPSKTLDWLLTKSKAAIKELVQTKERGCASGKSTNSNSPSQCENGEAYEYGEDSKGKSGNKNKGANSSNLVKESRAKARARARERTREKMCIKQLNDGGKSTCSSDLNYNHFNNIPIHEYKNNQLGVYQLSAGSSSNNMKGSAGNFHYCALTNEAANQDLIQEPVVIKRKSKNPSFFGFHQQNVIVSRDLSSNYVIPAANAPENWDICAILDQHKFINSSSNI